MTKSSLDSGKRAEPADHAKGHRVRMRGKLLKKGSAAPTELEILEMLLYAGATRGDAKPLAKRLIRTFKSLSAQFEHSLGITDGDAEIFTLSPAGFTLPPYNG